MNSQIVPQSNQLQIKVHSTEDQRTEEQSTEEQSTEEQRTEEQRTEEQSTEEHSTEEEDSVSASRFSISSKPQPQEQTSTVPSHNTNLSLVSTGEVSSRSSEASTVPRHRHSTHQLLVSNRVCPTMPNPAVQVHAPSPCSQSMLPVHASSQNCSNLRTSAKPVPLPSPRWTKLCLPLRWPQRHLSPL